MIENVNELQSAVSAVPTFIWILFIFLVSLYIWGTYPHKQLKHLGIPGPPTTAFLGNLPELKKEGHATLFGDLVRKYGKVYSFYMGRYPCIVVADPEMIKQIMIKDFSAFTNRSKFIIGDKISADMVLQARDQKWKFLRTVLSPNFSAKKLRGMIPLIHIALTNLEKKCETFSKSGEDVNINSLFGGYTMDVIASTSFGIEVDSQNNPENPFVENARKIIQTDRLQSFFIFAFISQPLFRLFMRTFIFNILSSSRKFFLKFCSLLLNDRRAKKDQDEKDLLQMMIKTQENPNSSEEMNDATGTEDENLNPKMPVFKRRKMTDQEIIAQCMIFFIAGYETTASTLSFMAHSLSLHPEIQEKVHQEIKDVLGDEPADYENIQKLQYLEQCMMETLRKYPIATRVVRESNRDITIKNWHIPKDSEVIIPIYAIHHSSEYWTDPEKFDPDRFSPESQKKQVPFSYIPFGGGPRICIGMRLAQLELKMAMVHVLRRFKFVPCEKTENPLTLNKTPLLSTKNGITLKIEKL